MAYPPPAAPVGRAAASIRHRRAQAGAPGKTPGRGWARQAVRPIKRSACEPDSAQRPDFLFYLFIFEFFKSQELAPT
jgi:hypothetical protein